MMINIYQNITNKHALKETFLRFIGKYYLKSPERIWATLQGTKMKYPPGILGGTTVIKRILGIYEYRVFRKLKKIIKPNMTIINLGACYGDYAIFMAKLIEKNKLVYAFEPFPYFFKLLSCNVKLNKLEKKIVSINKAVDKNINKIEIDSKLLNDVYAPFRKISNINFPKPTKQIYQHQIHNNSNTDTISVIKLSDYIAQEKIHPDLLMMDIEGFELSVLEDIQNSLIIGLYRPIIIFESHDQFFPSPDNYWQNIQKFTDNCKYQIKSIDKTHFVLYPNNLT